MSLGLNSPFSVINKASAFWKSLEVFCFMICFYPGKIPEPGLWSWGWYKGKLLFKWHSQRSNWSLLGEGAEVWGPLSSPLLAWNQHVPWKSQAQARDKLLRAAVFSMYLCFMSGSWMEERRAYFWTILTRDLDLAAGSWKKNKKCWSSTPPLKIVLCLWPRQRGTLVFLTVASLELGFYLAKLGGRKRD